jgi:hypothetical protein
MVMVGFMAVNKRKAQADLNPTSVALWLRGLWVGMLLEAWWSAIWLALWRMAHWENPNHNRNDRHRESASPHRYPGDDREAGKTDEKTLRWLLNQVIQEFGRTGEMNHGMFHTILQRFSIGTYRHINCSKFHAMFSQAGSALGDGFRKRLQGITVVAPA